MNRCKRTARLYYERRFDDPEQAALERFRRENRRIAERQRRSDYQIYGPPPLEPPDLLAPPRRIDFGMAAYALAYVILFLIVAGTMGAIAAILSGR